MRGMVAASVILEEIHHQGYNAAACHAQMYTMGTVLRHGSEAFLEQMATNSKDKKSDMSMIGQFGVGFYASFMVSDSVDVLSFLVRIKEIIEDPRRLVVGA